MTFKTTNQNTFKKDYLKGLEYKGKPYKRLPVVEIFIVILFIMTIIACVHIYNHVGEETIQSAKQ